MRSAVKRREDFGFTGLVIELLSAAKRGRGRGPLRSNGKVRWCQTRCDVGVKRTKTHLTYPALCAGPLPLPPRKTRAERTYDAESFRRRRGLLHAPEAEQRAGDAADLDLLRAFGDAIAPVVAVDVLERCVARIADAAMDLDGAIGRLTDQAVGA